MIDANTRIVESVGDPGRWVAQYYDADKSLWFDMGDSKATRTEAITYLVSEFADIEDASVVTSTDMVAIEIDGIDTDRMSRALNIAYDEFWATILRHFPEVESGDVDPGASHQLETMMRATVHHWLQLNYPTL